MNYRQFMHVKKRRERLVLNIRYRILTMTLMMKKSNGA